MGMRLNVRRPVIKNSRGEPITLTPAEKFHVAFIQRQIAERFGNALGSEVDITTLTTVVKRISEQKFFEVAPADYVPVRVGEGAWSTNLTTFRSFDLADSFETGIINTGGQNSKLAQADAAVDSVTVRIINWAKGIGWSIFDLQHALKAGNWDLVEAKERARKKNWDLGIQRIAFLGAAATTGVLGLMTQTGVTTNTLAITKAIKNMTPTELAAFCAALIEAYRSNCNRTAWPTHLVVPESDYNGLSTQASPDFPIKSKLAVLEETFQTITRNKQFKILPNPYGDIAYSGLTVQKYVLLNYDEESIRMDIPVDYTNTLANSIDNFSFQNAAYGQFTGVQTYRPLELMYFVYTPA